MVLSMATTAKESITTALSIVTAAKERKDTTQTIVILGFTAEFVVILVLLLHQFPHHLPQQ